MKLSRKETKRLKSIVIKNQIEAVQNAADSFLSKYRVFVELVNEPHKAHDKATLEFLQYCLKEVESEDRVRLAYFYDSIEYYNDEISFDNYTFLHNHFAKLQRGIGIMETVLQYSYKNKDVK